MWFGAALASAGMDKLSIYYDDRQVICRQYQTQHKSVTSLSMHAVMTTSTLSVILRL